MTNLNNAQIKRLHGDDRSYPIATWRRLYSAGVTDLPYVDWRADLKFAAAQVAHP